jgi:hypothetical protein
MAYATSTFHVCHLVDIASRCYASSLALTSPSLSYPTSSMQWVTLVETHLSLMPSLMMGTAKMGAASTVPIMVGIPH